jgi:hypothetical protein
MSLLRFKIRHRGENFEKRVSVIANVLSNHSAPEIKRKNLAEGLIYDFPDRMQS